MNAIQLKERVDFYNNRSRSKRYTFGEYNIAFREAQMQLFDMFKTDPKGVRENLYTLKVDTSPAVTVLLATSTYTVNHISYPTDFHFFQMLNIYVDGVLAEVSDITDNEVNRMLNNSFRTPVNKYVYKREDATGWKIYRGVGGTVTADLTYLMSPSDFYLGNESDLIDYGTSVLTFGVNYTAVEESVHAGITYNPGDSFNATSTVLTSGQVIKTSILVGTNLPEVVQEDLCKVVSNLMSGSSSDYTKAAFVEKEVNKTL